VLFLFVILLMTIGLPEGGCVVSICYIVDDHWFARGWLCGSICYIVGDHWFAIGWLWCFYLLYC
jgi:hypothetical protein